MSDNANAFLRAISRLVTRDDLPDLYAHAARLRMQGNEPLANKLMGVIEALELTWGLRT